MEETPTEATPIADKDSFPVQKSNFLEDFMWDWYIIVRLKDSSEAKDRISDEMGTIVNAMTVLKDGIASRIGNHNTQLWPNRLVENTSIYCWLIGIPNLPSSELSECRTFLKQWQKDNQNVGRLEARFVPQKVVRGLALTTDVQMLAFELSSATPKKEKQKREIVTGENFKKLPGSNPKEVRRQFLHHAMGSSTVVTSETKGKLRPVKDILNRLKFDASYDSADYIIGYIDRKAGILEKAVDQWADYDDVELIAYIKHVNDDTIVWDRVRKVDLISTEKDN